MKPLHDQVLVETILDEKSVGGVLLPDNAREQGMTRKGKVLAVGPGKLHPDLTFTTREPVDVKEGDVVWFDAYAAAKVENGAERPQFLVSATRILAIE